MDSGQVKPLVVIVGPTASGKTALSIELAEQLGGEIICADSRTIYKGMDIGTAKPGTSDRSRVPHWGLDLVSPDQSFTVSDFKEYATAKIAEIQSRGKTPFLVGGSGLYVDAVLFDYQFGERADMQMRAALEQKTIRELQDYCHKNNISLPENSSNKRYIIRAIERKDDSIKRRATPISTSIIVGLATDKTLLRARIADRSEQLFMQGVVEEAIMLGKKYGWEHESMTGNIYPLIRTYLEGKSNLSDIKYKFSVLDWKLAKRQLTWFRRNPYIIWQTRELAAADIQRALVAPR